MTDPISTLVCAQWKCSTEHYAKGLCKKHYQAKLRREGRLKQGVCTFGDCGRAEASGGLCTTHLRRKQSGEPMDAPIRVYAHEGCNEEGCSNEHSRGGFCKEHDRREVTRATFGKYGLDASTFAAITEAQNGMCAICGVHDSERQLVIDHDHAHCGGRASGCPLCVRGLLCMKCNTGLGFLENTTWRIRADAYLESPPVYGWIPRELPPLPEPVVRHGATAPFAEERMLIEALREDAADRPLAQILPLPKPKNPLCMVEDCKRRPRNGEVCAVHRGRPKLMLVAISEVTGEVIWRRGASPDAKAG